MHSSQTFGTSPAAFAINVVACAARFPTMLFNDAMAMPEGKAKRKAIHVATRAEQMENGNAETNK